MSRPSTPPGPIRPLMSAEVIAFRCQPWAACSLRIFSSLSPDILPPSIFSRTSTTLYSNAMDPTVAGPVRSAGGVGVGRLDRGEVGSRQPLEAVGGELDVVADGQPQHGVRGVPPGWALDPQRAVVAH